MIRRSHEIATIHKCGRSAKCADAKREEREPMKVMDNAMIAPFKRISFSYKAVPALTAFDTFS
jgi:hypothetical protein